MTLTSEADYIIIGAGSAGCVLAARLSEDADRKVVVLERGGDDGGVFIQMPTALSIPMNMAKYNWFYESEPEPHLGNRRMNCPRGKVVGGSSSINGMVYVRGNPCDYDNWEELGATGWAYRNCLPYFRKAETYEGGADSYRGDDGPLQVTGRPGDNPLYPAFVEAAVQAGYHRTDDYNGYRQEGFGWMQRSVGAGRRSSASNAYLKPALSRPNLELMTDVLVTRILFDGKRATGVEFVRGNETRRLHARREVILAGGSINTPQLLQISGVGNAELLREHGIEVVHNLPAVGENLHDHLEVRVQHACTQPITLNGKVGPLSRFFIGARWVLFKSGLGASNHFEACGFIRTHAGVRWPNAEYHFIAAAISYDGTRISRRHGYQVYVGPLRTKSRGRVRIRSADPAEKPSILFNYMSHADDWTEMRACIRHTREIFAQPAFDPFRGEELAPGPEVQSDDQLDAFIRDTVEPAYHPVGTCRMGREGDSAAVVDPEGRVHGLSGLRIVDSSLFPQIVTGNTNAATIMLAEKLSDCVRERDPLPPSNAPAFVHPDWQTRQR